MAILEVRIHTRISIVEHPNSRLRQSKLRDPLCPFISCDVVTNLSSISRPVLVRRYESSNL
jgi:hypothetical protein